MTVAERYEYSDDYFASADNDPGGPTPEDEAWLWDQIAGASDVDITAPVSPSARTAVGGWPTLDPAALQGLPGEVVRAIDPHTEADPAGILADFLTGFGNAAGSRPHMVADGARHTGRLFSLLAGRTSKGRKGTAHANVAPVLHRGDPTWSDARHAGGLSTGEGLINAVADRSTEDDDGAPTATDKRLMVVESEFARVLAVTRREGSTLSHVMRDAWDTGTLRVLTRKDPITATGSHISLVAHITVDELRSKLTTTDQANGFANRLLFVCVDRSKRLPHGEGVPAAVVEELGTKTRQALTKARNIDRMARTPEAARLWEDLYDRMAEDDPGGLVGAITARPEAQTLRLSVVYAIAAGSPLVEVEHLEAAYAFWTYCRDSAAYLFGNTLGDPVADKLLAAVRAAGPDGMTGTEQSALFGRHVSASELETARAFLWEQRLARTTREDTAGRPRIRTVAIGSHATGAAAA